MKPLLAALLLASAVTLLAAAVPKSVTLDGRPAEQGGLR